MTASTGPNEDGGFHELESVGARAAAPGRSQARPAPAGGSASHEVESVRTLGERSEGPPRASSAPSGGSAVREATSVGAISSSREFFMRQRLGWRWNFGHDVSDEGVGRQSF